MSNHSLSPHASPDYYDDSSYENDDPEIYDDEYSYDCGDYQAPEVGYCNAGWIGAWLFVIDGLLAVKCWYVNKLASAKRNDYAVTHPPATRFPLVRKCYNCVDFYLIAVVSFLIGAINDTLNYNVWWSGSNGPWRTPEWGCTGSTMVWIVSGLCYLVYCFMETSIIAQFKALILK